MVPKDLRDDESISKDEYTKIMSERLLANYTWRDVAHRDDYAYGFSPAMFGDGLVANESVFNAREAFRYSNLSVDDVRYYMEHGGFECAHVTDWSLF